MLDEFDIQSGLLLVVVVLILIILFLVYRENSKADEIKDKISNLKMECPSCPSCPECPDVSCPEVSCPDNPRDCPACPDCPNTSCPKCPKCPDLPNMNYPTVNEIIDGIFPGRDQGVTLGGDYFPLQAFTESCPIPGDPQINELPLELNAATIETDISLLGSEKLISDNDNGNGNDNDNDNDNDEEDVEGFINYLPILH
jgi:hypothetical protein